MEHAKAIEDIKKAIRTGKRAKKALRYVINQLTAMQGEKLTAEAVKGILAEVQRIELG